MINPKELRGRDQGFTIIELMIATAVLSTILVTVTVMMISIGNLYYKGVNQARVQDDTRSIIDEVSQNLEFYDQSSIAHLGPNPDGTQTYCIGTTRYTYVVGVQIGTAPPASPSGTPAFDHVLWRDTVHSANSCTPANLEATNPSTGTDPGAPGNNATNGVELISPSSRLVVFSISPSSSPYTINIGVAYGDNDLLCSPAVNIGGAPSCSADGTMSALGNYTGGDLQCKGSKINGSQFCSVAKLSTTAVQRLTLD